MLEGIRHAFTRATWTKSSPFATKGYKLIFLTLGAVKPRYNEGKISAREVFF
jgi:hypothetical protein